MHRNNVLLSQPRIPFRSVQVTGLYLLHHGDYFGADMVKASTICVKRYWSRSTSRGSIETFGLNCCRRSQPQIGHTTSKTHAGCRETTVTRIRLAGNPASTIHLYVRGQQKNTRRC